jgi:hypothetical protein
MAEHLTEVRAGALQTSRITVTKRGDDEDPNMADLIEQVMEQLERSRVGTV